MKILITAFEPFGADKENASLEVMKRLPVPDGCELIKETVPVVFGAAADLVNAAIDRNDPDAVICLGQAGGRSCISLEKKAVNLCDSKNADNEGNVLQNAEIVLHGKEYYLSALPLERMLERLVSSEIAAEISESAGTYVCNSLLYGMMHHLEQTGKNIPAGFIHVPYYREQTAGKKEGTAYMELDEIVKGIGLCIECLKEEMERPV